MSIPSAVKWVLLALFLGVLFAFVFPMPVHGQEPGAAVIKKVPVAKTRAYAGDEMYRAYCASCHGVDGKGRGPAASAMKMPLPDLTTLSRGNGGKFPELHIVSSINGDRNIAAHGSKDMPVWGAVFREMTGGNQAETQLRVRNLTKYIETLQVK